MSPHSSLGLDSVCPQESEKLMDGRHCYYVAGAENQQLVTWQTLLLGLFVVLEKWLSPASSLTSSRLRTILSVSL